MIGEFMSGYGLGGHVGGGKQLSGKGLAVGAVIGAVVIGGAIAYGVHSVRSQPNPPPTLVPTPPYRRGQ